MPQIIPVAAPGAAVQSGPTPSVAADARARAIAMISGNANVPAGTVQNANSVQPEEMTSISQSKGADEGQKDTIETTSESQDAEAKAPEDDAEAKKLSSQYAILARKEKQLRQQKAQLDADLKGREAQLAAREAALAEQESRYKQSYVQKDRLKMDPLGTLQEMGLSYDEITQLALNPPAKQDPRTTALIEEMRNELKALKDAQESSKKTYQESQTQAYQDAVNQLRNETRALVSSNPEFETIKETGSVNDVVDLIERTWKEEKRMMTVQEAAQEVENYLTEEAMKLMRLKKLQNKFQPKAATTAPEAEKQNSKQPQTQMKTLTNAVGAGRQLTARERALLAFKGELGNK